LPPALPFRVRAGSLTALVVRCAGESPWYWFLSSVKLSLRTQSSFRLAKKSDRKHKRMFKLKTTDLEEGTEDTGNDVAGKSEVSVSNGTESLQNFEEEQPSEVCAVLFTMEMAQCFSLLSQNKQLIAEGTLQILKIPEQTISEREEITRVPASIANLHLLRIGNFVFPLTKVSFFLEILFLTSEHFPSQAIPCLRMSKGYYVVPTPENTFYGFVMPKDLPEQYIYVFESILESICLFRSPIFNSTIYFFECLLFSSDDRKLSTFEEKQNNSPPRAFPTTEQSVSLGYNKKELSSIDSFAVSSMNTMASGIEKGSQLAAKGIESGGLSLQHSIEKGGQALKSKLTPSLKPVQVNPQLASVLHTASTVSPYFVKISKGVVKGLAIVAREIASVVSDNILDSEFGKKLTSPSSTFNGPKTEAAKQVGKVTLNAIVSIWDSLENAGKALLQQTSSTAVDVIDHKSVATSKAYSLEILY